MKDRDAVGRPALSERERSLLKIAAERFAPDLRHLTHGEIQALPLADRNLLRSALGSLLTSTGFTEDWSLTPDGREIEDLIDKLGP